MNFLLILQESTRRNPVARQRLEQINQDMSVNHLDDVNTQPQSQYEQMSDHSDDMIVSNSQDGNNSGFQFSFNSVGILIFMK